VVRTKDRLRESKRVSDLFARGECTCVCLSPTVRVTITYPRRPRPQEIDSKLSQRERKRTDDIVLKVYTLFVCVCVCSVLKLNRSLPKPLVRPLPSCIQYMHCEKVTAVNLACSLSISHTQPQLYLCPAYIPSLPLCLSVFYT